jgi:tetratricopeptide (TPR) repeat protein
LARWQRARQVYLVRRAGESLRLQQGHSFAISCRAKEAFVLTYTRRLLLVSFLLLLVVLGPTANPSEPKSPPKQIAQWVEQLGDNDFKVRENASKKLWQAGAAAESALEKAVKSGDPEVVRRARELLDKFHWGIYPDTPADIVALIRAYQSSEGNPRMEVLQRLLASGEAGLRAVLKIASAEKDENQRKMLGDLVANQLPSAFLRAVTEGKYEQFERLLELGHEGKFIENNLYAAYWQLRGQLTQRIAHFRARLREHPEDKWLAQTLAYLHRANGNLVEARKAAEKSDRTDLLEGILFEMGDWKTLADKGTLHIAAVDNPAEKWAYRAAFARLAGKQNAFENAVRELRKCVEEKHEGDSPTFVAAKGLLLNDRPADGMELLRTVAEDRQLLFDILCARLDFAAAMDLAKKEAPSDKLVSNVKLARARLLCLLGEKEGEALFDRYAERIKDGVDPEYVESLLKEEKRAGLQDRAFAHAAKAMSVAPPKNRKDLDREEIERFYLAQLFPQQTKMAEVWWAVLRRQFKDEPPATVLKRLRELMEGKVAAKDVKNWIDQAVHLEPMSTLGPVQPPSLLIELVQAWLPSLAEAAIRAGLDDLACSLLEKEKLKKMSSRIALLHLGDLLAAKKQWDKAAEHYRQAWTKQLEPQVQNIDRHIVRVVPEKASCDPLPLYLAGDALIHAGREKEGQKLIEQAHWIPFADAKMRYNFLRALVQRGHKEASERETELLLRVSEPNTIPWGAAVRRLAGAALARKDYLKAAEGFEQSMLGCLNSTTSFVEKSAFANEPAKIHQLRACGLLAAGKLDEALKHAELALTHSPGYIELPIALVPELDRRGHKKEATDLFNRCYGVYEKVCRTYPRCAWAHNSAAWLSACCRRNLDQALQHAQKAVELAPDHAGYFDTLAEVHFQRGDKEQAIALQKRAIELEPKKPYFRKQLKRLEAGDPSAERPPEYED